MKLADVRQELAAAIADVTDVDVVVADYPPDQLAVPAVFILWATPWLQQRNRCNWDASLDVLIVSTRFEPDGSIATIEDMVEAILPLLAGGPWRFQFLEAPGPLEVAGITYLAARLTVVSTIDN